MINNEKACFFCKKTYQIDVNVINMTQPFINIIFFSTKKKFSYPPESDNTMLFPMLVLILFTFFTGIIGIPFNQLNQDEIHFDILSKLLTPSLNLLHQTPKDSVDWYEFVTNAIFSISIASFGIFIASSLYKPLYSSLQNWNILNSLVQKGPKRIMWDKIITVIYYWSYNRGHIDAFYEIDLIKGIRRLAEFILFFDRRVIDGITNGVGVFCFFIGEGIKYVGGGRISYYLLFSFF